MLEGFFGACCKRSAGSNPELHVSIRHHRPASTCPCDAAPHTGVRHAEPLPVDAPFGAAHAACMSRHVRCILPKVKTSTESLAQCQYRNMHALATLFTRCTARAPDGPANGFLPPTRAQRTEHQLRRGNACKFWQTGMQQANTQAECVCHVR